MTSLSYFDLHCDTPTACFREHRLFDAPDVAVSPRAGEALARWTQVFAVWIPEDEADPWGYYQRVLADFRAKYGGDFARSPQELTAPRAGLLAVEGGALLEGRLSRVDALCADGVRSLTLTWNGRNEIASGCHQTGGLTPFGARVIARLNRCGMATDLAHLNAESFWDALACAKWPIVTHACLQSYARHPRNLDDRQLTELAARGGLLGLCFYPGFFASREAFPAIYEQLSHICRLGLSDFVACGSDFDGAQMSPALSGVAQIPALFAYLAARGIPESVLHGFFYENAARFFKLVLTNAAR